VPDPLKYLERAFDIASAHKLVPLMDALLAAKRESLTMQDQMDRVGRENKGLREKLRLTGEFVRREGVLWLDEAKDPGPYCTACWDTKHEAIRISFSIAGASCPACEESYGVSDETRQKYGFPKIRTPEILIIEGGTRIPDQF